MKVTLSADAAVTDFAVSISTLVKVLNTHYTVSGSGTAYVIKFLAQLTPGDVVSVGGIAPLNTTELSATYVVTDTSAYVAAVLSVVDDADGSLTVLHIR